MEVLITLTGDKQAQQRFRRVAHNTETMLPVWAEVSEAIAKTQERSWGKGVTLVSSTVEKKAAAGRTEPLVWTGHLKESLTHAAGGTGAVREVSPYELKFGTGVFYARFLQKGTKNMNKKRVLRFTVTSRRLVGVLLMRHLTKS